MLTMRQGARADAEFVERLSPGTEVYRNLKRTFRHFFSTAYSGVGHTTPDTLQHIEVIAKKVKDEEIMSEVNGRTAQKETKDVVQSGFQRLPKSLKAFH